MEPFRRSYPLSAQFWRDRGNIEVEGNDGTRICTLPIGSLQRSGDLNWDFVQYCLESCVESIGNLFYHPGSEPVDLNSVPQKGIFVYKRKDEPELPIILRRGPIGKKRGRAAADGSSLSASTMSNSKRSTVDQNKFRLGLIARDGRCLITDTPYDSCTACHIVPFSRPDIYANILGYRDEWLFEVWMGLLLDDRVHRNYDNYDISIFPRGNVWVIHVFYSRDLSLLQYHGRSFGPERFNLPTPYWPMAELLLWHHRQCVQMHYRGFSHKMSAEEDFNVQT